MHKNYWKRVIVECDNIKLKSFQMTNLCREIKTLIYVRQSFSANPAIYGITWKTLVDLVRPQMTTNMAQATCTCDN